MLQVIDEIDVIYCNYKKKIYKHALFFVKDRYLAEDITQEVFIKFYYNRMKFNGQCSLSTWLYKLTRNHCIDYLRTNYAKKVFTSEELVFSAVQEKTPESECIIQSDIEDLKAKINVLPPIYKEVICLYYFCNCSLKEIHCRLNMNISTAKTRLHRGKLLLNSMYGEDYDFFP